MLAAFVVLTFAVVVALCDVAIWIDGREPGRTQYISQIPRVRSWASCSFIRFKATASSGRWRRRSRARKAR
jgi:hypothetical protein